MFLSPSYKTIELLPIVESLFDLGQKGFRQWAKRLSTLVDNKKEYKMSFNIYNICILCTPIIALDKRREGNIVNRDRDKTRVKANF